MLRRASDSLLVGLVIGGLLIGAALVIAGGVLLRGEWVFYAAACAICVAVWGNHVLFYRARADCLTRDWGEDTASKRRWLFWLHFRLAAVVYYFRVMRPGMRSR